MNAKMLLFSLGAAICLAASVAMAGPRGSAGASAPRMSGGGFSSARTSGGSMSAARISTGGTSTSRFSNASAITRGNFSGVNARQRIGTGNSGLARTNHWSGNNNNCNNHHHHHHHGSFVFIDTFGYPYWYDYPYSYYDYDPVVYSNDGSLVAEVQQRLARAGYYRGPVDGVLGPRTQAAIRSFERDNGLRVDGLISNGLIATMGLGYARN